MSTMEWAQYLKNSIEMYKRMIENPIWKDSDFIESGETKQQYFSRLQQRIEDCKLELEETRNEYYTTG